MMWVQFPSGVRVKYNAANYVIHGSGEWKLCDKDPAKGGSVIAVIQATAGAIVEICESCHVENATTDGNRLTERLVRHLRDVKPWNLKDLKRELTKFNSRSSCWKD